MKLQIAVITTIGFLSSPCLADQIVQVLPALDPSNDQSPYYIDGLGFDPNVGTLTGVQVELKGQYTADILTQNASMLPPTVSSETIYTIGALDNGSYLRGGGGTFLLQNQNGMLTGRQGLNVSGSLADLGFFAGVGSGVQPLLSFGVFSVFPVGELGAASDFSSFDGTLTLTYDYVPVPEPSTFWLLAAGVVAASLARRQFRQRL